MFVERQEPTLEPTQLMAQAGLHPNILRRISEGTATVSGATASRWFSAAPSPCAPPPPPSRPASSCSASTVGPSKYLLSEFCLNEMQPQDVKNPFYQQSFTTRA